METANKNVYDRIFCGLKKTFEDKESTYKDIRELLAPGTGYFDGEEGPEDLENQKINYMKLLDSEPITFLDTTVAGLFGGLINPASRWFDLGVDQSNPLYRELDPYTIGEMTSFVKEFLYYLFNKSNFYTAMRGVTNEWVRYGIGVMLIEERDQDLIFFNPLTIGEYYLGIDSHGKYDKLGRKLRLRADQMKQAFGDNCPPAVMEAVNSGNYDKMFEVQHLICPNPKDGTVSNRFKFVDLYWMRGCGCCEGPHYLRRTGFMSNPIIVFPWERKNARTAWPIGIGEKILGDVRELQQTVKALNIHKSYLAKPALALHTSMGKKPILPGSVFYTDQDPTKVASEIYRVNSYIPDLEDSRNRLLDKIRKMSYSDILMLFAQKDRGTMTAREVTALVNEQMTLLAPIYLYAKSGLESVFERVIDILLRRGLLDGYTQITPKDIQVEFLSSIAKAQKLAETGSMDDLLMYIGNIAQVKPEALDYINEDAMVIEYAERLGCLNKINPTDEVEQIRQARAMQQQQQQQLMNQQASADIAKTQSQAEIAPGNLLGAQVEAANQTPGNGGM
jgi:hypothetical protein